MPGPPIQRSASFQSPATARLDGVGAGQAVEAPRRLSQAAPAPPARALSKHTADLQSLLSERLAGSQPPDARSDVSNRLAQEFDPEEINAALRGLEPSQPQAPFSFKDAVDFRTMMGEACRFTALHLEARLKEQYGNDADPGVKQRLSRALLDLQDFKAQVSQSLTEAKGRADTLQGQISSDTTGAEQLRQISLIMGGRIKEPNSLKNLWKFSFSDNRRAKAQLSGLERAAKNGQPFVVPGPPVHLQAAMAAHLKGILKRAKLDDKAQIKAVKGELAHQMALHNERSQAWQTIRNTITLQNKEGKPSRFENLITPAKDFSQQVAKTYPDGQKGVSCLNNTNSQQTVNLWKTEFQAEGSSLRFSALRHGIHDAYKIKDADARQAAATAKVDQFLRAAVDAYPEKLKPNGDGSYRLELVSVSLVSPGKFGNEGQMWAQQSQAYNRANQQPFTMTADLGDGLGLRDITVQPRILAFSTPVNSVALESAALRPFLGGLATSAQANEASIRGLLGTTTEGAEIGGLAGAKLAELDLSISKAQQAGADTSALTADSARIKSLVAQVRQIMNAAAGSALSWQRAGSEPYKLASRLTALAHEVGAVPAFNCKSGKDRTGELDVQVKQLYARYQLKGEVPPPNAQVSPQEAQNHAKLVREGGSFQIQKDNTSLPGSKVEVKALVKPLMNTLRADLGADLSKRQKEELVPKEAFKGLSSWVGS